MTLREVSLLKSSTKFFGESRLYSDMLLGERYSCNQEFFFVKGLQSCANLVIVNKTASQRSVLQNPDIWLRRDYF